MKLNNGCIAALVMTTALVAPAAAQAPQDGEHVTVSGCLQRAQRDGSGGGTVVGTTAPPNVADREANSSEIVDAFLLADASPIGKGSATGGASADAAATGTSGRTPTSFGLQGREAELERYTGARVEVTGTVIAPATSGRGTGGAATAAGARRLRVESFKVVAEKCAVR